MAQDVREMFVKDSKCIKYTMKKGHQSRFEKRLQSQLPVTKKSSYFLFKVAASVLVIIGLGLYFLMNKENINDTNTTIVNSNNQIEEETVISFGDLSPDLKRIENYYVTTINVELSQLPVSSENKTLVDSYMEHLETLNEEYKKLNTELNTVGPNDQTVSALIKNLQFRLQLLQKLKKTLNEFKTLKNEQII